MPNNFQVFHGTNPSAADAIANEGFKLARAGTFGGSLYGRGVYACESATKADEYSRDEHLVQHDDPYCAMLVCRALCARVYYTAEARPDPVLLENMCKFNKFDSVLGDREKARKTYKEWIFYKEQQLYPEYIIRYKRKYDRPPYKVRRRDVDVPDGGYRESGPGRGGGTTSKGGFEHGGGSGGALGPAPAWARDSGSWNKSGPVGHGGSGGSGGAGSGNAVSPERVGSKAKMGAIGEDGRRE